MSTIDQTVTIRSPYDGRAAGTVQEATWEEADAAIEEAGRAFSSYRTLPRYARADILDRAADVLDRRREELSELIVAEAGKPIYDARGEVSRSIFNLRNSAAEARRFAGEEVPLDVDEGVANYQVVAGDGPPQEARSDGGSTGSLQANARRRLGIARRVPTGPVLAITPFNFPLNLVLHKVAPALAVGATVVLKPAPQTPLSSLALAEVLAEAGLPAGVLSVVPCSVEVAERMVADPRLSVVTFTGSAAVGWHIKDVAGKKKVLLELGGNGAVIVEADADLAHAADRCVRGGMVYAGQYCIGVQRILVHERVVDDFLAALVERLATCRTGDPSDGATQCGPVIDEASAARIEAWISEATAGGAEVVVGGTRDGTLVQPTVLRHTAPGMKVEDEEVFGPVVTVNPYRDLPEAVARVNASRFGLQAGLFTSDVRRALQAADELDVGTLVVNDAPIFRIDNMPFGGVKDSGLGREGTRYAMEELTDIKLLILNYA